MVDREEKRKRNQEEAERQSQEFLDRVENLKIDFDLKIFKYMMRDGDWKRRTVKAFSFSRNVEDDVRIDDIDIEGDMIIYPAIYGRYCRIQNDLARYRSVIERELDMMRATVHIKARKTLIKDPDTPNERITDSWVNAVVEEDEHVIALRKLYDDINNAYWETTNFMKALDAKREIMIELLRTKRREMDMNHASVIGDRFEKKAQSASRR